MFLDFASGIFIAIAVSWLYEVPLTVPLLCITVFFAFLPDVDYLLHLGKGGNSRNAHRHREGLHYPLLFIPVGTILLSFIGSMWAVAFAAAAFLHFMHDSIGMGWGVQWLYPFRTDHYTFFYHYRPKDTPKAPRKKLYIWKAHEIDTLAAIHGDPEWIRNIYLRWHPYAIVEFLSFLVALAALYVYLK